MHSKNHQRGEILTTPTLTFAGLGSARKASVTPRMGSLGAGSTWRHHAVDMDRAAPELARRNDDPARMRCAIGDGVRRSRSEGEGEMEAEIRFD